MSRILLIIIALLFGLLLAPVQAQAKCYLSDCEQLAASNPLMDAKYCLDFVTDQDVQDDDSRRSYCISTREQARNNAKYEHMRLSRKCNYPPGEKNKEEIRECRQKLDDDLDQVENQLGHYVKACYNQVYTQNCH